MKRAWCRHKKRKKVTSKILALGTEVDCHRQKWQEGSSRTSVSSVPGMSLALWGPGRGMGLPFWARRTAGGVPPQGLAGVELGKPSSPLGTIPSPETRALGSLAGNPSGTGIAFQSSSRLADRNPWTRRLGWKPNGWDSTCAPSLSSYRPPPPLFQGLHPSCTIQDTQAA